MTPPSLTEIARALQGSLQLAQLDPRGLAQFDRTAAGFWRSFYAAVLVAPLRVYAVLVARPSMPDAEPARMIAVEAIAYAIGWLIYPFVMLLVVDLLGRRERYFGYLATYNWVTIPQALLQVFVITVAIALPAVGGFLFLMMIISLLVYQWFIARVALGISNMQAIALALFEFALGLTLDRVTQSLIRA